MSPTTATSDDLALIRHYAQTGAADAFAAVVARHADFVFATALRQTGRRDIAEDVTQATFIVLARRAASLRAGTSVAAFLHQTAVFAAKNAVRASQRRRRHEAGAAVDPRTPAPPAERDADDDAAVAVDRALARLREADRHLLMLHYFDGLTVAEAGAKLAISQEAARKRLHRALKRLREQLQQAGATLTATAIPAAIAGLARTDLDAPAAALASTAVAGGAGGSAFALAHEVARSFQLLALKKAAAVVLAVTVLMGGATVAVSQATKPSSAASPPVAPVQEGRPWPLEVVAGSPATTSTAVTRPVVRRREPASRPAATHLVDYPRVFDQMRRTADERARLEAEQAAVSLKATERAKQLGALRHKAATTAPADRAALEAELRVATAEHDELLRNEKLALEKSQSKMMLDLFREIEAAIQQAAVAQGVTLPAFPPYPPNVEEMRLAQLRPYLMGKRFISRPPGVPDLTERVLAILNRPSTAPASRRAASRPLP